jgi:hypothetical protein
LLLLHIALDHEIPRYLRLLLGACVGVGVWEELEFGGGHLPLSCDDGALVIIAHGKSVCSPVVTIVDRGIRILFVFVHECKFFLCEVLYQHHVELLLFFLLYLL